MKSIPARALAVLSVLSTPQAFAQTFTEGFENGSNEGAWAVWWNFPNVIETTGGNPDAFVLFERALELGRERDLPDLEEALTLQAYAAAERSRGEHEAADQLMERARELYRRLGIEHVRHPWTDVYGAEEKASGTRVQESRPDEQAEVDDEAE